MADFSLYDPVPVGLFVIDRGYRVRAWNRCMEAWTGISRAEILGEDLRRFFPRLGETRYASRLGILFDDGPPIVLSSALNGDLFRRPGSPPTGRIHQCTIASIGEYGEALALFAVEDRSEAAARLRESREEVAKRAVVEEELRKALEAKDILMREANHRVKNNLSLVASLIGLQAGASEDSRLAEALRDVEGRIASIAQLHEFLYKGADASSLRFDLYLESIAGNAFATFLPPESRARLELDLEPMSLPADAALKAGLAVAELITNALKYGVGKRVEGRVVLSLGVEGVEALIRVEDDGPGLPPGFDAGRAETLGLRLVGLLSEELGGALRVLPGPGAAFEIRIKRD